MVVWAAAPPAPFCLPLCVAADDPGPFVLRDCLVSVDGVDMGGVEADAGLERGSVEDVERDEHGVAAPRADGAGLAQQRGEQLEVGVAEREVAAVRSGGRAVGGRVDAEGGVDGARISNPATSESIFLPAGGYKQSDYLSCDGSEAWFWSSDSAPDYGYSQCISFRSANIYYGVAGNYDEMPVRPVCAK